VEHAFSKPSRITPVKSFSLIVRIKNQLRSTSEVVKIFNSGIEISFSSGKALDP